jgi:hypothetical protein
MEQYHNGHHFAVTPGELSFSQFGGFECGNTRIFNKVIILKHKIIYFTAYFNNLIVGNQKRILYS